MNNYIFNISYFLILILPFSLITGPAIPDITISILGLLFLFLLISKNTSLEIYNNKWIFISLIFWFFILFISFFSQNKYLAYRDAVIFIRILFIPIFIYSWLLFDEKKIEKILLCILIAVLFVIFDTIYQFTNYSPEYGFGEDILGYVPEYEFYGRLTGPFKDLIPGAYVSKFSLFGLAYFFLKFKNNKLILVFSVIYLTLAGVVTYISGERMALATFLLGIMILILFAKKKRFIFILSFLLIIFSSYSINKLHPIYNDYKIIESSPYHLGLKIEKTFKCNENKNDECKKIINIQPSFLEVLKNFKYSSYGQIYSLAFKMWKDHPMQGIGMNNFYELCKVDKRYINSIKKFTSSSVYEIKDCVSHPHNIYLQWLVEIGIFGLIIFLVYVFSLFYFIYNKKLNLFNLIGITALVILFWPIMSTGSLLKNWMGVSSFFIIGISLSLTKIKNNFT